MSDYYSLSEPLSIPLSRHSGQLNQGVIDLGSKPGWNYWKEKATQKFKDYKLEGLYQVIKSL